MKTAEIMEALRYRHQGDMLFPELRGGAGYGGQSNRYIDAWAMCVTPSKGNPRTAYEIKTSRPDFLRELKKPAKRKAALLFSNQFYFATPTGIVKPEELPPEAGLIEVRDLGPRSEAVFTNDDNVIGPDQRYGWTIVVTAPWRDTPPPSWRFVVSLLRNSRKNGA